MTALSRTATELYIVDGNSLWSLNVNTGQSNLIKFQGFKNTTAMTAYGDHLYIASDGYMYKVDGTGKILLKSGGFGSVTSMGAFTALGL